MPLLYLTIKNSSECLISIQKYYAENNKFKHNCLSSCYINAGKIQDVVVYDEESRELLFSVANNIHKFTLNGTKGTLCYEVNSLPSNDLFMQDFQEIAVVLLITLLINALAYFF